MPGSRTPALHGAQCEARRLRRSAGIALALHAALIAAVMTMVEAPARLEPQATTRPAEPELHWLELHVAPQPKDATPGTTKRAALAAGLPSDATSGGLEPRRPEPPSRSAPASLEARSTASALDPAERDTEAPAQRDRPEAASEAKPSLSLAELGVGAGHNPFWQAPAAEPPLRAVLNQRVQQMLKSGLAAHDQEVGLGPEGPAVKLVERIVQSSPSQPNTSGLLSIRTDARGFTTHVEVLETDSEPAEWERIARELKRELAQVKLRIPSGSAGVSLQLRVVSRVQLPSGADPGLTVELLGQPLVRGTGERSSRLSLLSPKAVVTEVEIPYTDGRTMPAVGFSPNIIAASGDLADLGAAARRIVRARLVALETHVAPTVSP